MFQEVAASEASFERYIGDLFAACRRNGVKFRFECDVAEQPDVLAPFDRLVIATGAALPARPRADRDRHARLGRRLAGRRFSRLFSTPMFRDWFYYKGRRGTADRFRQFAKPGQIVIAIGDAVRAGKSKEAIASAFEAALLPRADVRRE